MTQAATYWRRQARAAVTGLPCTCNAGRTHALHAHSTGGWGCFVCNKCHALGPNFSADNPTVFVNRDTHKILVEADCLALAERASRRAQKCECCGEPATTQDIDGVPLCDGDYQHLLDHAEPERVARIHSSETVG